MVFVEKIESLSVASNFSYVHLKENDGLFHLDVQKEIYKNRKTRSVILSFSRK